MERQRNDSFDERMKRLKRDVEEMRVELRHTLQRLEVAPTDGRPWTSWWRGL